MRVLDLFAGCGGLSLGFQNAGFKIVAAFENWHSAIQVYQKNFQHSIVNLDLSNIQDYSLFSQWSPDMIIGGPRVRISPVPENGTKIMVEVI